MPHIHTNYGDHDHTASAYIFRLDGNAPRVMLHVHKKLGVLMQFGGHVEINETPWQAILHEVVEETGYQPGQLRVLQPEDRLLSLTDADLHPVALLQSTHTFPPLPGHFHTDTAYVFTTEEYPASAPAEGEATNIVWLTEEEVTALGTDRMYTNVKEIVSYAFSKLERWNAVELPEPVRL